MAVAKPMSVMDVMMATFPNGYVDHPTYLSRVESTSGAKRARGPARALDFANPPASTADLFALMGHLLLRSGAYHHVGPQVEGAAGKDMIVVTAAMRKRWQRIGKRWRGRDAATLPPPPKELIDLWEALKPYWDHRVFRSPGYTANAKTWWKIVLSMFCIADEAALDIGFETGSPKSAQAKRIESPIRERYRIAKTARERRGVSTIAKANPDLINVLPKSRTPKVGCTIRSLSHNLALLPGRGQAQARWSLAPETAAEVSDAFPEQPQPFNVVVLPMPFRVRSTAFKGIPSKEATWGWFEVEPHWCPPTNLDAQAARIDEFAKFVSDVLDTAAEDCGEVHGLVLPEVALSYGVFRALCERLKEREGFELLISGLFDAMKSVPSEVVRSGNFTGMARFTRSSRKGAAYDLSVREKHHRWRLDRSQIETYALGSALDVNLGWWEHIDIHERALDIFTLRGGASVTTLICEDLARNDPCQELVRGIGPNLVVALLMDGPQRADRWPARYATVLAEDPGSSVLSVTCYGMIERTNRTGAFPIANQIGLFRDDTGKTTEIKLAQDAQAVCLTLQPSKLTERTLDGRDDKQDAQSWRLSAVQPVRIKEPNADIMRGDWPRIG